MKRVAIVQTSLVSHGDLNRLFAELVPEAELINIVDDSLLKEVKTAGHVTPGVVRRLCAYFVQADQMGVDLIFNQCSSVGEATDIAARLVTAPVLKVDAPMAEEAVRLGSRIALVATVESTVGPSGRLVEAKAKDAGREITLVPYLVKGALEALMTQGAEKHNAMVLDTVRKAAGECDVVVLAQGSMTVLEPLVQGFGVPVLTSLRRGVVRARQLLGL